MKKILVLVFTAAGYFANAQAGFTNTGNLQIHGSIYYRLFKFYK